MNDAFEDLRHELERRVSVPPFSVIRRRRAAKVHAAVVAGSVVAVTAVAVGTTLVVPHQGGHGDAGGQGATTAPHEPTVKAVATATPAAVPVAAATYPQAGPYASYAHSPLPLDAFRESPADDRVISIAAVTLWNACRTRYGLSADIHPYLAETPPDELSRAYTAVQGEATAARWGYSQPAFGSPPPVIVQPRSTATSNLVDYGSTSNTVGAPQSTRRIVTGTPVPLGGCQGEAYRAIGAPAYLSMDGEWNYAGTLQRQTRTRALADPVVLAANRRWSSCMANAGYRVETPLAVLTTTMPAGHRAEVAMAEADVACQGSSHVYDISLSTDIAYEKVAIAAHRGRLEAAKATWQGWVDRAKVAVPASAG